MKVFKKCVYLRIINLIFKSNLFVIQGDPWKPDVFEMNSTQLFFTEYFILIHKIVCRDMPFEDKYHLWKITSGKWCSSSWMQFSSLRQKSAMTRVISSSSIVATSSLIVFFSSANVGSVRVYTWCDIPPQKKVTSAQVRWSWGAILHKCAIRKKAMFNHPPLHSYWNGIEWRD